MSRPAEAAGGVGAAATAIALAFDASTAVVGAVGIVAGLVPAVVTWLVANGGVRGAVRRLWRGTA